MRFVVKITKRQQLPFWKNCTSKEKVLKTKRKKYFFLLIIDKIIFSIYNEAIKYY